MGINILPSRASVSVTSPTLNSYWYYKKNYNYNQLNDNNLLTFDFPDKDRGSKDGYLYYTFTFDRAYATHSVGIKMYAGTYSYSLEQMISALRIVTFIPRSGSGIGNADIYSHTLQYYSNDWYNLAVFNIGEQKSDPYGIVYELYTDSETWLPSEIIKNGIRLAKEESNSAYSLKYYYNGINNLALVSPGSTYASDFIVNVSGTNYAVAKWVY